MSRLLSPAARGNVSLGLSALALLVATSGTAYALANGSVKTKHLANAAVTTAKIKDGQVRTADLGGGAVTAPKVGPGAVTGPKVADGSLTGADLADGSVLGADLADGSVDGSTVLDGSLRLADLGGSAPTTTTVQATISIAAGECRQVRAGGSNPAPNGTLGSLVIGTITSPSGGAVVSNSGFVVPTLVTETSQGGVQYILGVCAGSSAQSIPLGSIITYRLVRPD